MTASLAPRARETTRLERLVIWKCTDCAALHAPLTVSCSACGSDNLTSTPSAGEGVIVSWRAIDRAPDLVCCPPCPSIIAIVELDEGPWVYTWIESAIALPPDQPVRVYFRHTQQGERFPIFEPGDSVV
ncbi:Zn-ribbon domain-containing OB-fold protein [Rhodococcus koreensis]|uniref:Zn-ribbon domain-containing OB-fold protein n=1 Tax=Rhodococcus koreensis TaxID=99653 RepID=UPI003671A475